MRYGERVSCPGFYFDPADPDGSRIYYLVDIFKTPAEAVARLEESGGEKVIDATESAWEEDKKVGRLLVQSGIRNDGDQKTGSCVLSYIDGSMLIRIGSSVSCEAARAFFKGLTAM